jgi:hypothetical protein
MRRNAQPGHARHAGSTQIMETPAGDTRQLIEEAFGMSKVLEDLGSQR